MLCTFLFEVTFAFAKTSNIKLEEFLASTSKNMDQKSRPVVKMVKKRSKLLISSSKGPGKREKSVASSSPRLLKNNTQGLVLEHSDVGSFNKKGMCSISNVQAK